jgi:hypothetical protein
VEIVVTDLTRMHDGHICVAGLDHDGHHIRPVLKRGRLGKELASEYGGPFCVGAVIELGPTTPRPDRPEVEDHVFDPSVARRVRMADAPRLWRFLEERATDSLQVIFGDSLVRDGRTASMAAGTGYASLGVYRPAGAVRLDGSFGRLRLSIGDAGLGSLSVPITDLRLYDVGTNIVNDRRVELLEDRLRRRQVLLSMGIGRPWARDEREPRHWLQVNNVHLDDNVLWPNQADSS